VPYLYKARWARYWPSICRPRDDLGSPSNSSSELSLAFTVRIHRSRHFQYPAQCLSPATPSYHRARRPLPKPTTPFVTPEDKENLNFARHHIMLVHSRRNHETDSSTLAVTPSHMRIDPQTRAVVGAVIGSVVAIILAVVAFLLWRRCRTLQPSLGKGDQENPRTPSDVVDGKSSQGEKGGESDQGRPSSGMCYRSGCLARKSSY
jgi:hypothetical protein